MSSGQIAVPLDYLDAGFLRVAAIAIGAYEYLLTIPDEYRFIRSQIQKKGISQKFVLFVLIRYLSIIVIIISNIGFFGTFTARACRHFMFVSPIFKVLQTIVSQLILAMRTYAISRGSRKVAFLMISMLLVSVSTSLSSSQTLITEYHCKTREPCTTGNPPGFRVAWLNYAVTMIFDLIAIIVSSVYLWSYRANSSRIPHFIHRLIYEGLGYFAALTAANIYNLVLYRSANTSAQSSAASLGYVIIFIMSQRILILQRDYADNQNSGTYITDTARHITSRTLDTSREINDALRSQFETTRTHKSRSSKSSVLHITSVGDTERGCHRTYDSRDIEGQHLQCNSSDGTATASSMSGGEAATGIPLDVHVRIERVLVVEPNPALLQRESYKTPRVAWGARR